MDIPHIIQNPETDEMWLIDGDQRMRITPAVYNLLVNNGADVPPTKKLLDENARLRKLLDEVIDEKIDAYNDRVAATLEADELRAENAKLRKIVAYLMRVKPHNVTGITYDGNHMRFDDLLAEVGMRWDRSMSELGIEVDSDVAI